MKNVNKLVALLLALTLIVGMMPGMTVHVHAEETEYPEIVLDTETTVNIDESGEMVYFTFTPETTHSYTFYADGYDSYGRGLDTEGYLYDSEMNELAHHSDISWSNYNFSLTYTMEAGTTYILGAKMYNQYLLATFPVYLVMNHECEGTVTTPATCTEDGVMTYTCVNCDYSYTESIPAGHNYENGYCTGCGEEQVYTGECGYYGDNLTWTLTGSGKLTISGEGMMAEYHPYYVPNPWSQYASLIKTVEIEEGVTTIGDYAFNGCNSLTEASIPSTVNKISDSAFRDCAALTSVDLSEGLATIEGYAFQGCTGLTSLSIPDSVSVIGSNAFKGCYNITALDLGEGVVEIGGFAFYQCTGLTEVVIPDSVTTMGSDVFHACSNLAKVKIPENLGQIPTAAFAYTALTEVDVPASVTMIGDAAFQGCTSLSEVTLHEGLLVIGGSAFENTALVEVKAPSTIKSFNQKAFKDCKNLKSINIPEGMVYMLYSMFEGCTSLERVVIPSTVQNMDANVFYGCTSLTEVVFTGSMPEIMDSFGGVVADVYYPGDDASYTEDVMLDYGGDLTWHPMCPADKHTWDTWAVTEEPTCTESGEQVTYCLSCGVSKSETIAALGHDHSDAHVVEPTCTEQGYTTYTCTRCLDQYTDDYVDALGHDYEDVVTAPECTEAGYTTHTCTRCGDSYVDTYADALGHDYESVVTEPTCTEEGYTTHTCIHCGDSYVDTYVDALGHDYESVVTEPTETEKGYTTHTCTHCGDSYVDSYVAPIPEEPTVPGETTPEETEPEETKPEKGDNGSDAPQTGDAASGIWLVLMVISLFGITALVTGKKWAVK